MQWHSAQIESFEPSLNVVQILTKTGKKCLEVKFFSVPSPALLHSMVSWLFKLVVLLSTKYDHFTRNFIPFLFHECFSAIQSQEILVPPMIPYCTGNFELVNCSSACMRASCIQKLGGPVPCPRICSKFCVCKDDLLYDDCSEDCVHLDCCPSLEKLKACKAANEN